ncbi:MAG: roadblock/LC7 domain-containing protein [Deltaproteobacteria bacterium]|nr:roadblock/LC7 domain-containing protein [Deltaproteobacteria bacterium]
MRTIAETIVGMLDSVPGLKAVVVIDSDGIPVTVDCDIDMEPDDLGAVLASAFQCYQSLGEGLGQFCCELVTAGFDGVNVAQHLMPRGALILIAEKSAPMGVVRVADKTGRLALAAVTETTADARKHFMEKHKFSLAKPGSGSGKSAAVSLPSFLEKRKKA